MNEYPKELYCFKRWNEHTKKLIAENALYFANPKDFNDDFDSKPYFDPRLNSHEELKEYFKVCGIKEEFIDSCIDEVFSNLKKPKSISDGANRLNCNHIGIFCVTRKLSNPRLWGYYADRGICISFNTTIMKNPLKMQHKKKEYGREDKIQLTFKRVSYNQPYPKIKVYGFNAEEFERVYLTKHQDWEHEEEYRCILPAKDGFNSDAEREICIKAGIIQAIYMRHNFEKERELIEILKNKKRYRGDKVKLYRCVPCSDKFDYEYKEILY